MAVDCVNNMLTQFTMATTSKQQHNSESILDKLIITLLKCVIKFENDNIM